MASSCNVADVWVRRFSTLKLRLMSADVHGAVLCLGVDAYQPQWLIGRSQRFALPCYMFVYTVIGSNLRKATSASLV